MQRDWQIYQQGDDYKKKLLCVAKVFASSENGAGENDIYKPALWTFDKLEFLNDTKTVRP